MWDNDALLMDVSTTLSGRMHGLEILVYPVLSPMMTPISNIYDVEKINESIIGISGNQKCDSKQVGKIHGQVNQVDGTELIMDMYPVKYCTRATENMLFHNSHFISED